jgi:hypothetical protein
MTTPYAARTAPLTIATPNNSDTEHSRRDNDLDTNSTYRSISDCYRAFDPGGGGFKDKAKVTSMHEDGDSNGNSNSPLSVRATHSFGNRKFVYEVDGGYPFDKISINLPSPTPAASAVTSSRTTPSVPASATPSTTAIP